MEKFLDRTVSIAIIVVSIVFLGVVAQKYWAARSNSPALTTEAPLGKKLDLSDINWEANGHTVILALQKSCRFCNESVPFYQRLSREMSGWRNISIVAALPDAVESSREHLKKLELPIESIREVRLKSVKVSATLALLVADKTGTVVAGWIGKLSSDEENKVLKTLFQLSQAGQ